MYFYLKRRIESYFLVLLYYPFAFITLISIMNIFISYDIDNT